MRSDFTSYDLFTLISSLYTIHTDSAKNTTDPATKNPIRESAGPIASDSLAAESTRSGGAFSENRNANPLSVSGSNSTLANTDISGATTLGPASDKVDREAKATSQDTSDIQGAGGMKYPEAMGGQGEFPGVHNTDGYYGGSSKAKQEMSSRSKSSEYKTSGSGNQDSTGSTGDSGTTNDQDSSTNNTQTSSGSTNISSSTLTTNNPTSRDTGAGNLDQTPSSGTTRSSDADLAKPSQKPKGKNLTEGGFDSDPSNNASLTSDIGTENDPGRIAEQKFQRANAESGPDAGSGPRQKEVTGDGQFDVLEEEQSL